MIYENLARRQINADHLTSQHPPMNNNRSVSAAIGEYLVLGELLKRLRERTALLFAPTNPARQALSWQEHAAILEAIIHGDERSAATLASQHVIRAGTDFLTELVTAEVNSLPVEKTVGHRKAGRRGALK